MSASLSWIERCPLPLAVIERSGGVLFWSRGAERLTGLPWEEVVGRHRATELLADPREARALLRSLREHGSIEDAELVLRRRHDSPLRVRLSLGPLYGPGGEATSFLATATAVSEREPLAERGALHDLAHLLAVALPQTALLREELERVGSEESLDRARTLERALHEAAELAGAGRSAPREPGPSSGYADLLRELHALGAFLRPSLPAGMVLEADLGDQGPLLVRMPPAELWRVLQNLVLNARSALGDAGRIEISAARREDPLLGNVVRLFVEDDGPGVPSRERARVFEPHAGGPSSGAGQGLGLFVARRLVELRGGSIRVDRGTLGGARFEIVLPEAEGSGEGIWPRVSSAGDEVGAQVLVVEDDPVFASTLVEALTRLGHAVHAVGTAREALEAVESLSSDAEVALVDAGLPDRDGRELLSVLEERRPGLVSVLCSGEEPHPGDDHRHLRKPFSLAELDALLVELRTARRHASSS